ncbi:uncharacterized protein RJT21DRAFT_119341 [Scheffersomyces amazonensis]|uniref:uncharacterized protein n=1 Tax=Scheffersomyces amazonensis TaxID=1078765 RepID=UPI00315D9803
MFRRNLTRWQGVRFNGTTTKQFIRSRPKVRDLIRAPIFKSFFLTIVLGTVVVDYIKTKKDYELLVRTHESKFTVLQDLINNLKNGDKVDVARELKIANTLTKNRYGTVTDIEVDEELEKFLKMADSQLESDEFVEKLSNSSNTTTTTATSESDVKTDVKTDSIPAQPIRVESSKFL